MFITLTGSSEGSVGVRLIQVSLLVITYIRCEENKLHKPRREFIVVCVLSY